MKAFAAIAVVVWAARAGSAFAGQVAIPSPAGHAEIRTEDDASRFSRPVVQGQPQRLGNQSVGRLRRTAAVALKLRGLELA